MRLFFALWPPRETAEALHAWALAAQRATGGRVTRAGTIHLTLAFLGEIEERLVPDLSKLSATGERHSLPIEEAGYWPHNRLVWVGPRETPEAVDSLVRGLALELQEREFKTENKTFSAHITLIRKAQRPGELPALPAVRWPVQEFVLVRSRLSATGPDYEVLERYALT